MEEKRDKGLVKRVKGIWNINQIDKYEDKVKEDNEKKMKRRKRKRKSSKLNKYKQTIETRRGRE